LRNIFYTIYRSSSIEILLNTLLAEAVLENKVRCTPKNVKAIPGEYLIKSEKIVLEKIKFGQKSNIRIKYVVALRDDLLANCLEKKYLKKFPVLGLRKTRKFKKEINKHLHNTFNQNIIKYVDSENIEYLKPIISDIDNIEYPGFRFKELNSMGYREI
jgi:polyribonucleotide nucleotidyltransferase